MTEPGDPLREEIMEIYGLPESLREAWRAGWRGDTQPILDFPGFVDHMLGLGYTRNPCRDSCPDHGDADHVHLRTPDGDDVIAWADGRLSYFDLTQPARLLYPVPAQRHGRFGARVYRNGRWS